ncbi:MAG: hypothetical protein H6662_03705 [Ardenticatenaceae bacterium]|nr:hypothetical protein [Ardenticatenaceae bacterium]MCB9002916.1 hypothetical protein [Ardenticatenaceae bacterium]
MSYIYRMASPDSIIPDPSNPQSFNRYSYVHNNPVNLVDPTGHFTCSIGSDGEEAGVSVTDCENWVNQTLSVLGLTETGARIVDWFWAADAMAGEGGIRIMVGGTIIIPLITTQGTVMADTNININEVLNSGANFIGDTLYLKPETIKTNPFDPKNWGVGGVSTFAHEAIHAYQGFEKAFTAYGEAEAFLYEGQLVDEMNALITQYNAGLRENDDGYNKLINQHSEVNRLREIIDTGPAPWYHIDNLLTFHNHPSGAYFLHRLYSWQTRITEDMLK